MKTPLVKRFDKCLRRMREFAFDREPSHSDICDLIVRLRGLVREVGKLEARAKAFEDENGKERV